MIQHVAILRHLKSGRSLTPLEALRLYGTLRLGARVYELRQAGYRIRSTLVPVKTRDGIARVACYRLAA